MKNLFALFFIASGWAMGGPIVYVTNPQMVDVGEISGEAVREILLVALEEAGAKAPRSGIGAGLRLDTSLIKYGESFLLVSTRVELVDGAQPTTVKFRMKKLEELDNLAERVARFVVGESSRAQANIGEISVSESDPERVDRRKPVHQGFMIGAGPAFLSDLGTAGPAYHLSLGQGWLIGEHFRVGLRGNFTLDSDRDTPTALFLTAGGSFTAFFMPGNWSPYASLQAGFGLVRDSFTGDASTGIFLGLDTGVAVLRLYQLSLEFGLGLGWMFDTDEAVTPGLFLVRVGVFY